MFKELKRKREVAMSFGENVGSGFPKIIAAWKETNWGEPQLLNKLDVDEVELVLHWMLTKWNWCCQCLLLKLLLTLPLQMPLQMPL